MTDTPPEEVAAIDGRMNDALSDMFAKHYPGTVMTKFVVIAEVIESDGGQSVWMSNGESMGGWDILGFLHFALLTVKDKIRGIDGDDED